LFQIAKSLTYLRQEHLQAGVKVMPTAYFCLSPGMSGRQFLKAVTADLGKLSARDSFKFFHGKLLRQVGDFF
jgi:hypothetical protein